MAGTAYNPDVAYFFVPDQQKQTNQQGQEQLLPGLALYKITIRVKGDPISVVIELIRNSLPIQGKRESNTLYDLTTHKKGFLCCQQMYQTTSAYKGENIPAEVLGKLDLTKDGVAQFFSRKALGLPGMLPDATA